MKSLIEIIDSKGDMHEVPVEIVGRKLHLLRGVNRVEGLSLTDTAEDETGWYKILSVSDDCEYFDEESIGKWVYLPEISVGMSYRVGPGERIVREQYFESPGGPPLATFEEEE